MSQELPTPAEVARLLNKPEQCIDCQHFEEWPRLGTDMGRCPEQAKALASMATAPYDAAQVILPGKSASCPLAVWSDKAVKEAADAIVDDEVRRIERDRGFAPHQKPREAA